MKAAQISKRIDEIIESNIKKIPYEGITIDKEGLKNDLLELIKTQEPEIEYRSIPQKGDDDISFFSRWKDEPRPERDDHEGIIEHFKE